MNKRYHDFAQGSDEWHTHRAQSFNASDAAAMLGISPYKTRDELLKEYATGEVAEITQALQAIFKKGHEYEKVARPWAEEIIGGDLFTPTISIEIEDLKLSASFDGALMIESDGIWEHKTLNESLSATIEQGIVKEEYRPQMEQCLLISGANKCLFMASDGNKDTMVYCWYESDHVLRQRIVAGWKQIKADLAEYEHQPEEIKPEAKAIKDLPAVSIRVNGEISLISNLDAFGQALSSFVDDIDMEPKDDQAFVDAENAIKVLKRAQDALDAAESSALAQTASIDDMRRTKALYWDMARKARLALEKTVKVQKETIRVEILNDAQWQYASYRDKMNESLGGDYLPIVDTRFALEMKGKKSITSLRGACNDELARLKIEVSAIAEKIRTNLATTKELAEDYKFLFMDIKQIVVKENDDFTLLVRSRIDEHKKAEAAKLEAEREQIRYEEQQKAEQKADVVDRRDTYGVAGDPATEVQKLKDEKEIMGHWKLKDRAIEAIRTLTPQLTKKKAKQIVEAIVQGQIPGVCADF